MKKIISMLQPFDAQQTIIVYENGNKIDVAKIDTPTFVEDICKYVKAETINEIDLGGARRYAQGIGKKIQETAATEYAISDIEIVYI